MRIVLQGSATPKQLGKAVEEILTNTLEKAETKGKKYPIHNAVIEFSINVQGEDKPMLLIDSEEGVMLTIHSGIDKGELVEYVEVDRSELVAKFDEMLEQAEAEKEAEEKEVVQ